MLSAAFMGCYIHTFQLTTLRWLAGVHLLLILGLQVAFFLGWRGIAQAYAANPQRVIPFIYTGSWLLAGLVLNLIYALQFLTNFVWGSLLTPEIAGTFWRQFHSLVVTEGSGPVWALAAVVLTLGAIVGLLLWRSTDLWAWLRWATSSRGIGARRRRWPLEVAALGLLLVSAGGGVVWASGKSVLMMQYLRSDPLLALWLGSSNQLITAPATVSADLQARRQYSVTPGLSPRNVIVVTVDCLRADHLSMFGYPRETAPYLRELTDAGRLQAVDYSVAVSNASKNGIMGVLGSRYPEGLHTNNFRLQDVLKLHGYRTHVIVSGDHTAFEQMRRLYGDRIDLFVDGLQGQNWGVNDDRNVLEAVQGLPPCDGRPNFFFLHLMSAHMLGVRLPESARWTSQEGGHWMDRLLTGEVDRQLARDVYDNGVLQSDLYLRRIFAALEEKGYLQNYVAVITADHGESLGEHGPLGHRRTLFDPEVRVPTFFLESGDFRYGRLPFASQVDVAPTVLDRLGMQVPSSWQGRSLLTPAQLPLQAFLTSALPSRACGIVEDRGGRRLKYLFDVQSGKASGEKIYDLSSDPEESRNVLAAQRAETIEAFRKAAAEHFGLAPAGSSAR